MWVDVKTVLLRVEETSPLPMYFCQEYCHWLQWGLDLGLREGEEVECDAAMEETTCVSQSHAALLLEAEVVKGGHPDGNELTSGAL